MSEATIPCTQSPARHRIAALAASTTSALEKQREVAAAIYASLDNVAAQAASSRDAIRAIAAAEDTADHGDLNTSAAALFAVIDNAEARKRSALETEAIAIDALLGELIGAHESAASLLSDPATTLEDLAQVQLRLEAVFAASRGAPCGPVESPTIRIVSRTGGRSAASLADARVSAPLGLRATDIHVAAPRPCTTPAGTVCALVISERYVAEGEEELVEALLSLQRHARVSVSLRSPRPPLLCAEETRVEGLLSASPLFTVTLTTFRPRAALALRGVDAIADLGAAAPPGTEVWLDNASFAGQPVAALPVPEAAGSSPSSFLRRVFGGMRPPLVLLPRCVDIAATPCITGAGTLFLPQDFSPTIHAVGSAGSPWFGLSVSALGLSQFVRVTAYDFDEDLLLIADACGRGSRIVAVEEGGFGAVRWATAPSAPGAFFNGMSVLPGTGFVAVSCTSQGHVYLHSLTTGARVVSYPFSSPFFLAAARSDTFVSGHQPVLFVNAGCAGEVSALNICPADLEAVVGEAIARPVERLVSVDCVGSVDSSRPLAFIGDPPAGSRIAGPLASWASQPFLVVGAAGRSVLQIVASGRGSRSGKPRVVHTHRLDGFQVMGIAADPAGAALAVCDRASRSVHILPWPLPGMPTQPPT